jgi:hypothetical protein
MKSFKDLFIKSDDEEEAGQNQQPVSEPVTGFPVVNQSPSTANQSPALKKPNANPYFEEIAQVYENGLQSINMPGYDFFDFFTAIKAAGAQNEAVFKMAFQMGKTMDNSLTPQKLAADAEFYLSKLRDVHQKYADQGQQKLGSLNSQLRAERENLSSDANTMEIEISKLKQQILDLERKLSETRNTLSKVDEKYKPQQDVIEKKLQANDLALQSSLQSLNVVRDAILLYLR